MPQCHTKPPGAEPQKKEISVIKEMTDCACSLVDILYFVSFKGHLRVRMYKNKVL